MKTNLKNAIELINDYIDGDILTMEEKGVFRKVLEKWNDNFAEKKKLIKKIDYTRLNKIEKYNLIQNYFKISKDHLVYFKLLGSKEIHYADTYILTIDGTLYLKMDNEDSKDIKYDLISEIYPVI